MQRSISQLLLQVHTQVKYKINNFRYIRRSRETEEERFNAFLNKTYSSKELEKAESYDLLVEIPDTFKPELPARQRDTLDMDCYRQPADAVSDTNNAADYVVTYDDPVRSLVKKYNESEPKKGYDVQHLSEKRVASFKQKHQTSSSTELSHDKTSGNKQACGEEITASDPQNVTDKGESEHGDPTYFLLHKDDQSSAKINHYDDEWGDTSMSLPDNNSRTDFTGNSTDYADCDTRQPRNENMTLNEPCNSDLKAATTAIVSVRTSTVSDGSNYEDTTVYNDHTQLNKSASSPDLTQDHICLNCLHPAYLKKLGIDIVMEDNDYYTYRYQNLSRRFSASDVHTYYNFADMDTVPVPIQLDKSDEGRDRISDNLVIAKRTASFKASRPFRRKPESKTSKGNGLCHRKCSRCNENIYDTLGQYGKSEVHYIPAEEYSRLRDIRFMKPTNYKHKCCKKTKTC